MNGVEWTPGSLQAVQGVDATLEYYPNIYNGGQKPANEVITSKNASAKHYFGAHISWNNFPRHLSNEKYAYKLMHPSV